MSKPSATPADTNDVHGPVNAILEVMGLRLSAGSLTIHLNDGLVQKVEINSVHRPTKGLKRQSETA